MSVRAATIVAVALLAGARQTNAQDPRLERVDPSVRARVAAVIDSARVAGLPTEPLVLRALEGTSKGADGARILTAVRTLAQGLAAARVPLGLDASEQELRAGQSALRQGTSPQVLRRMREIWKRESLTIPLGVLADLIVRGVPADTASSVVLDLMTRGVTNADFIALRGSVEREIAAGVPPTSAISDRARGPSAAVPTGVNVGGANADNAANATPQSGALSGGQRTAPQPRRRP